MTIRWGDLLLLNSPKIGWESASPRQQVGKAIDLDKMTERDYPVRRVNALPWRCRTTKPKASLTRTDKCSAASHWLFGIAIEIPISVMAVMEFGVITIIAGFPPLSVAWTR
jgi:hypothetical protein